MACRKCIVVMLVFMCVLLSPLSGEYVLAAEVSNTEIHWGILQSNNHIPPFVPLERQQLLKKYSSAYIGDISQKKIYLTFDNGYENGYTAQILDVLHEKEVPAAFFVTGHYIADQPELIKRIVLDGHIVGNHTAHHPKLTSVSDHLIKEELRKVEKAYTLITGQNDMKYVRPPQGVFSERTLAQSEKLGYYNIFWSLAYVDWYTDEQKGWQYAYRNIVDQIHPGAVILLHSVSADNAAALPKVIDELRDQGYEFYSLDHLICTQFVVPDPFKIG